jgi:glycosyltransferase involved in cell wall biosynthesis
MRRDLTSSSQEGSSLRHAVIINDDCGESGGAASVALLSARLLRQRGFAVTFLSGDRGRNTELASIGVDVVPLEQRHIMDGARAASAVRGLYNGRIRDLVEAWIEKHDSAATIYHLHNWHKVLSPSVFGALERVAARLVISTHDYFLVCPNGGYFHYPNMAACSLQPMSVSCLRSACDRRSYQHKLWRVARTAVRRRLMDFADSAPTIVAVHEGMIPLLEKGGVGRRAIRVLRNPVTPWRTQRVVAEQNSDVIFVGRLERDKGVDLLAAAARRSGVSLRIVGDGPLRNELAGQYPEVQILGHKSRDEIARLIGSCRFLVAPSRWRETFGLVAMEALMSGVPVVASRHALVADEIARSGFGMTCDPYDPEALAGLMARLMADDGLIRDMSCRAFEGARKLAPTPELWRDELVSLYETVISRAGAAVITAAADRSSTAPEEFGTGWRH